jgi:Pyridoxamine 5'-phosphate oxidase
MSTEPQRPKLSDDLLELFASGVTLYVATCSAERMPESVPGMGIRVHPDRRSVTVYVPTARAAATLSNLRASNQVAATLCHPPDHRTVQLKGRCTGFRDGTDADREAQEVFRAALVATFAEIGIPRALTRTLPWWPSTAIDFEVRDVYVQTPGPNAGELLSE